MLGRLLDAQAPLHDYRHVIVGGARMSPQLRTRAEETGAPVVDAYGLSETWGGFALDGRPIEGARVRLGDDDEIQVSGPMVMRGYRGDTAGTAAAFTSDGWLRTGDVGRLEHGLVQIVDRARDLVISGGVNVSPSAVEAVLAEHPMVEDVCVTGAPDPEWGERVVAFVVLRRGAGDLTLDDLRELAEGRLTKAQLPRQLVVVDSIPRTAGGKARRRELTVPA
jgi:O-succinylbenzoic acid--CoA ligase